MTAVDPSPDAGALVPDSRPDAAALQIRPLAASATSRGRRQRLVRWIRLTDTMMIFASVVLAHQVERGPLLVPDRLQGTPVPVFALSLAIALGWKLAMRATKADRRSVIGTGFNEYARVLGAGCATLTLITTVAFLSGLHLGRTYWLVMALTGIVGLILSRMAWNFARRVARRSRAFTTSVVAAGEAQSVIELARYLESRPDFGYRVIGACISAAHQHGPELDVGPRQIPILGDLDNAVSACQAGDPDAVAITSTDVFDPKTIRELSWQFAGMGIDVLMVPAVLTTFGPRVSLRPHSGFQLLVIGQPRYRQATSILKRSFDIVGASVLIVASLPILAVCALAIKVGDRGPVFYRAERIGRDNRPFRMWKFRSMIARADSMRADLAIRSDGNDVLFKMREDPRVTRVGRVLRRYSLDELPQLVNVLDGSMSLVGPRPPLADEVRNYDQLTTRRMLVRPGMTGLWQVSGRSDLSWEESVHLDLLYVENWSMTRDLGILIRTVRAITTAEGAY